MSREQRRLGRVACGNISHLTRNEMQSVHLLSEMFPKLPNGLPPDDWLVCLLPNSDVIPRDSWFWFWLTK